MTPRLRAMSMAISACALLIPIVNVVRSATPDETAQSPAQQNWPQASGDLGNRRYSALFQINTATVKNLGAAWLSDKFDDAGTSRVTPVVKDGLMFLTAGAKVYALDAKTGKRIWKFEPGGASPDTPHPNGGGIFLTRVGVPNTQGVAVGEGKVFVAINDARMMALDEKTGKLIWSRMTGADLTPSMKAAVSASPVYVNGVIYTCIAFNEGRYIGRAVALDAKDGHEIWRWTSVPGPGEPGHETWTRDPKSITWTMGGADIWQPPIVDLDLGLVYYGTGNPSPNRSGADIRPGNNLYSCSVVALDMKTGKLRWYYQTTHHDLWEGDLASDLVAYDTEVNGTMRKGLGALRPDGTLFLLDRATGKPIWPIEERTVRQSTLLKSAPTQPFPVGRGSLTERDCSQWTAPPGFLLRCEFFQPPTDDPPNVLAYYCGVRSSPMSFSPQTGYFYLQGADQLTWEWSSPKPVTWEFGSTTFLSQRVPNLEKQSEMVYVAVDPKTYKVVWKKRLPMPLTIFGAGGFLSTAGGLAFHRLEDGNLVAYDAKTGDELWKFQTGLSDNSTATPMSYEVDGQQYIAIIMQSQVWGFNLGGTIPPRPAPRVPTRDDVIQGPIQNSQVIRAAVPDDYNYKHDIGPVKARVKAGSDVTFMNNSAMIHTFVASDGSWTTGELLPRQQAILTFDKPGTYLYHCKEHPWSYGLLIVTDASISANGRPTIQSTGAQAAFAARVSTGKDAY